MPPVPDTSDLYRNVFYVSFAFWFVPELIGFFAQRTSAGAKVSDRGSRVLTLALIWIGIIADLSISPRLTSAAIPLARVPIFWAGCALLVIGALFRWYAIRVLGRYFARDVAVQVDHQVVQDGPYRLIRHPSYTGGLISMLGLGLALGNWAGLALVVGLPFAGYLYRMHVEERALVEGIGEPYREYMGRTKRLIPFVY